LTITADRGSENKGYQVWEDKLGVTVYFCHAYHSWEKGTVENTIKRVRRFIPKGENVAKYSWRDIRKIE
jgi:IS30 family transposase